MDKLIRMHSGIMDKYDPEKKLGLIVDEWGTWYDVEPGTNPGFLYQQNTMRDAIVAGIHLNLFNQHSDRVKMTCIAQMVNVLQAVLLTDGDKLVRTPTYYVFDLFKAHQDAALVASHIETIPIGNEGDPVPNLSESASVDQDGRLQITITNLSCDTAYPIHTHLAGFKAGHVDAEILTGDIHAKNTFEQSDAVKKACFSDVTLTEDGLLFTIPACSVLHLTVEAPTAS